MTDRSFIFKPITTREEGEEFIALLHANSLMFHFEDDVWDIIWGELANAPSDVEIAALDSRRNELYEGDFDWGEHECPIGYALYIMGLTEED